MQLNLNDVTVGRILAAYPTGEFSEDDKRSAKRAIELFSMVLDSKQYHLSELVKDMDSVEGGLSSCWIEDLETAILQADIPEAEKGYLIGAMRMRALWEVSDSWKARSR